MLATTELLWPVSDCPYSPYDQYRVVTARVITFHQVTVATVVELFNDDIRLARFGHYDYITSDRTAVNVGTELIKLCSLWERGFLFDFTSVASLMLSQLPVQCVPRAFPWVRQPEREANHLVPRQYLRSQI
jgi:hypothetical protein